MIYFFHHYELPVIIQQAQVQQILRLRTRQRHHQQQQAGNASGAANSNGANQAPNENANTPNNGQSNDANAAPPNNPININNNHINNLNNNNNNTSTFNANRNVVIHIGNFFNQHMTATLIISRALNIAGAVRNIIANDIFGVAAIFNNNNDNNLNNNNATGAPTSHIRINLANLRRINLSGIQINPVERNDDRLDGSVGGGGENNTATNNENRTNDLDGNEIDADVQYDGETESTDECDNLLKKHVRSEEQQQLQEQFEILDLNDVSEKDGDIKIASVDNELPVAPTDAVIDKEIQAPNCHGDPDSIGDAVNVSIAHFDGTLNTDNVTANGVARNHDKPVDSVVGNHDYAVSIVSGSDRDKNQMEQFAVVDGKRIDDFPCIGPTTIASIEKFDSITGEESNLNSTGDNMVDESGDGSLASRDNDASDGDSTQNISSNDGSRNSGGDSNSNSSDSSKDSSGNRLPIVSPFK